MVSRNDSKSVLFVAAAFVVVIVLGTMLGSGPSDDALEADRLPTTTTTTEPPPVGIAIVFIDNAVMRPSNLQIDLTETQTVQWINKDDREYILKDDDGAWESPMLSKGDVFEFDYSTLEPDLHSYTAEMQTETLFGGQRIPGFVDTRPEQ